MTSSELLSDWLMGYPEQTRDAYRRDVEQFADWLEPRDLLEASRSDVQRWLATLLETLDLSPTTVRRKASAVSSFYDFTVQEGALEHNPCEHIRRPRGTGAPRRGLPIDQARALLLAASEHSSAARALVWLMAGAGLRVAEACSAQIEDINEGGYLRVVVKGGHTQLRPLSEPVLEAVRAAAGGREQGPILTNADRGPLSRKRAWELVERLTTSVGIAHCTPHTLRHTAATLALEAGAPVEDVQQLLGHRQLETTLRYIQNRDVLGGARKAADRLAEALAGAQ